MDDLREKVIKGLEHCTGDYNCEGCPYENGCDHELMGDALELLKAQEPHVMTPEEVERVEENGVIWEEVRIKDTCLPMIRFGNTFEGEDYLSVYEVTECDDYLMEYRCWSSKPTDEQRKAVKWE